MALSTPSAPSLSDHEIIHRVVRGEPELFELLVRRHNQTLYRAVRSIIRDEDEAEDAMQQAYLLAFSRLSQFEGTSKFSTWLVRIGINEALGHLRRARRFVVLEGGLAGGEQSIMATSGRPSPEEDATRHELAELLEHAADELPEMYRTVFVLRDVEGMSTTEAASALGTTEEVVRQRLHRARGMLDERLRGATRSPADEAYLFHAIRCDRIVAGVLQRLCSREP